MQRAIAASVDMFEFCGLFPTRGVATRLPKLRRLLSAMVKERDQAQVVKNSDGYGLIIGKKVERGSERIWEMKE